MHSNVGTALLVVRQIFLDACKLNYIIIIIIMECINILNFFQWSLLPTFGLSCEGS